MLIRVVAPGSLDPSRLVAAFGTVQQAACAAWRGDALVSFLSEVIGASPERNSCSRIQPFQRQVTGSPFRHASNAKQSQFSEVCMRRIAILILVLFVYLAARLEVRAQTKAQIIKFDAPGAGTGPGQGTTPYAINPAGAIAGQYLDASNVLHGFLRAVDGTITTIDAPGAGTGSGQGTVVRSINPAGVTP